jgi:hypothetical protein
VLRQSPPQRLRLLGACLSLAMVPVAACGNSSVDTSMPPLIPEPGLSLGPPPSDPSGGQAPSRSARVLGFAARVALQRFLRGTGASNPHACFYVDPAFEKTLFGKPGCKAWIGQADRHLSATQLAALRAVRVPTATAGPGASEFTVQFTDLRWSGAAPRPGGVLRTEYVLRKIGPRWLLAV